MLHTFYNIRKTLDSSGFPVILPNPNRITTKAKALNASWALFSCCAGPSKACFRKGRCSAKKASPASAGLAFALVVMARGGREKASQRLNPPSSTRHTSFAKTT